jgi:hypothetical protein
MNTIGSWVPVAYEQVMQKKTEDEKRTSSRREGSRTELQQLRIVVIAISLGSLDPSLAIQGTRVIWS